MAKGWIDESSCNELIGALIGIGTVLWMIHSKARAKRLTGLAAPSVVFLPLALGALLLSSGCTSTAPGHDPIVVNAERSHAIAVDTIDMFFDLEYENRELAAQISPEIRKVADRLRKIAPALITSSWNLIQVYKTSKTPEAEAAMQTELAKLKTEVVAANTAAMQIKAAKQK